MAVGFPLIRKHRVISISISSFTQTRKTGTMRMRSGNSEHVRLNCVNYFVYFIVYSELTDEALRVTADDWMYPEFKIK
jgi:hypothetical protein